MFYVEIPDWTDLESKQSVGEFPQKKDALSFVQEVFGADKNGKVETVTGERSSNPIQKVRVVVRDNDKFLAFNSGGTVYLPYAVYEPDKDYSLRDTAVRLLTPYLKSEMYPKALIDSGDYRGCRVFIARYKDLGDLIRETDSLKLLAFNGKGADSLKLSIRVDAEIINSQ